MYNPFDEVYLQNDIISVKREALDKLKKWNLEPEHGGPEWPPQCHYDAGYDGYRLTLKLPDRLTFEVLQNVSKLFNTEHINVGSCEHGYYGSHTEGTLDVYFQEGHPLAMSRLEAKKLLDERIKKDLRNNREAERRRIKKRAEELGLIPKSK